MDPISAILGGVGIATELYGADKAKKVESTIAADQQGILADEQAENDVRQRAVAMMAQRKSIQSVREAQMAGARSRAAAVQGGAQFGSGAKQGEQMAMSGNAYNQETISQDLQSANQMFSIDRGINALKSQIGMQSTSLSNDEGIMAIGGSILGAAGPLGKLAGSGGWGMSNSASGGKSG
jgi:hypothetical protein